MHTRTCLLIAVSALIVAGCAGDGPPVATPSTDLFSQLQREIFDVHCTSGPCHNPQSQAGSLVLVEGFSYQNLVVDSTPNNAVARAAGLQRVTPFNPTMSFLLIKLTDPTGEGDRMPLGSPPLSTTDLNLITQWILAGAPPPQTPTAGTGATVTPSATPTDPPPLPTATPTTAVQSPSATVPPESTPTTSPSPTATQLVTLADVQAQVFTPHCLDVGCHTSTSQAGRMVLEDGSSFAATVNVRADNTAAMNAGLLRVDPGNPDASFLLIKLTGPTPEQGSPMPFGKPKLSDDLIALVRTWIAQGAHQ